MKVLIHVRRQGKLLIASSGGRKTVCHTGDVAKVVQKAAAKRQCNMRIGTIAYLDDATVIEQVNDATWLAEWPD
jgi:hypothetical protein